MPKHVWRSGPQGLRRPRFSFFRFTFQTAREPGGSHLRKAGDVNSRRSRLASDKRSEAWSLFQVRCFDRRVITPRQCGAPSGGYIFGALIHVNTITLKNSRCTAFGPTPNRWSSNPRFTRASALTCRTQATFLSPTGGSGDVGSPFGRKSRRLIKANGRVCVKKPARNR